MYFCTKIWNGKFITVLQIFCLRFIPEAGLNDNFNHEGKNLEVSL